MNHFRHSQIIALHSEGKTNREIAGELGLSHSAIPYHLHKDGLIANGKARQTLTIVDGKGICNRCRHPKPLIEFRVQRSNAKYPYRLTYCSDCRRRQQYTNLNADVKLYLNDRLRRLKVRAKIDGVHCSLTRVDLYSLWDKQEGKCFYSDRPLRCRVGEGYSPDAFSIDRIIPDIGYQPGNVVLCTYKVNAVKNDLSLTDISEWMPGWYSRIMQKLNEQAV